MGPGGEGEDRCLNTSMSEDWKWYINKAGVRTKRTKTGGVLEGVGAMDINGLSITKDKLLLLKIFKVPLSLNNVTCPGVLRHQKVGARCSLGDQSVTPKIFKTQL